MSDCCGKPGGGRKRRMILYVAGPYRDRRGMHYVHQNIMEAREVAAQLWAWDYAVICPHTNTCFMDGFAGISDTAFLEGDKDMVEVVHAVVMLPRWESSEGARGERNHAELFGKPVFYWDDPKDLSILKDLGASYLKNQCHSGSFKADREPAVA